MILFLDDIRTIYEVTSLKYREKMILPKFTEKQIDILKRNIRKNVVHVVNYEEAVEFIKNNKLPEMIFFDNDLGPGKEGYDFLKWLCNRNPGYFEAYFHTANIVARKAMQNLYSSYLRFLE